MLDEESAEGEVETENKYLFVIFQISKASVTIQFTCEIFNWLNSEKLQIYD